MHISIAVCSSGIAQRFISQGAESAFSSSDCEARSYFVLAKAVFYKIND